MKELEERIEKEACAIQTNYDIESKLPKGYLDGMLYAFDLVRTWIIDLR